MALGLLKKHCPVCGQDVEKGKAVKKFGKYLCSEDHAEEYRKKLAEKESDTTKSSGGCCG